MKRVVLYSLPGLCPLCDEARSLLRKGRIEFEEIDIRTEIGLLRAYRLEIPVVTVDGRKAFVGHVELARLRALLRTPG